MSVSLLKQVILWPAYLMTQLTANILLDHLAHILTGSSGFVKEDELSFLLEKKDLLPPDVFFLLLDDLLDFPDKPDGLLFFNSCLHCLSESKTYGKWDRKHSVREQNTLNYSDLSLFRVTLMLRMRTLLHMRSFPSTTLSGTALGSFTLESGINALSLANAVIRKSTCMG